MSNRTKHEVEIEWEAPSGNKYKLLVNIWTVADSAYGADADGNRGVSRIFLDEYTVTHSPEELKDIITDPEDLSFFDLDFISEEVEEAFENLEV